MPEKTTFEWDEAAWRLDTEMLTVEARGVYREILGHLYLQTDRGGQVTGTREELARAGRCTALQVDLTIKELAKYRVCGIQERNGVVTLISRRMQRDRKKRENTCKRVEKHRLNGGESVPASRVKRSSNASSNAAVTLPPRIPLISPDSDKENPEKALSPLSSLKGSPVPPPTDHPSKGGASVPASRSASGKRLNDHQRSLAQRWEAILGPQWINDAGKWVNRIKEVDQFGNKTPGTFRKTERVLAEVESAAKENRIHETPAQYAEQIWKEFT